MTVPGVRTAEVDFDEKEVVVSYQSPATIEAMVRVVNQAGHYQTKLKHDGRPGVRHKLAPLEQAADSGP